MPHLRSVLLEKQEASRARGPGMPLLRQYRLLLSSLVVLVERPTLQVRCHASNNLQCITTQCASLQCSADIHRIASARQSQRKHRRVEHLCSAGWAQTSSADDECSKIWLDRPDRSSHIRALERTTFLRQQANRTHTSESRDDAKAVTTSPRRNLLASSRLWNSELWIVISDRRRYVRLHPGVYENTLQLRLPRGIQFG